MQDFDSRSKQDKFNKELNRLAADFIAKSLCPQLDDRVRGEKIGLSAVLDESDPHVVSIRYPAAFSEAYIRPEIGWKLVRWLPGCHQFGIPSNRTLTTFFPTCSRTRRAKLWQLLRNVLSGRR